MTRLLCVLAVLCLLAAPVAAQAPGAECIPPQEPEMSPMVVPNG